MFDLDEGLGITLLAIAIGVVLGSIRLCYRLWRNVANMPEPAQRRELLTELQRRKQQGHSFADRMRYLKSQGLRSDVAEGLISDSERKQSADVSQPQYEQRGLYSFAYPANWKLRPLDESLDAERYFCIESVSSAMVTVMLLDRDDVKDVDIAESLHQATKTFSKVTSRPIFRWGNLTGTGVAYTGELGRCPLSGIVFLSKGESGGVQLLSVCLDEDIDDLGPGLKLIEQSFDQLRAAA